MNNGGKPAAPPAKPVAPAAKPAAPGKGPEAKPTLSPEMELTIKIRELEAKLAPLRLEVKTLQGRMVNRDPVLIHKLKKENEASKARLNALRSALFAIITDSFKPRQPEDAKTDLDVLRNAAVEYFKKVNVAPELWKSIES